ncbi:MAG TPA: imidazole glycerol phosphate synthase subunit HisH [Burkholderiales bacterium]|nr:imidazole glycerol phosphate synthase subunit HisH [Burkholderiales bacterium]
MNRIAVVDYGMGNLRSVSKAIEHVAPRADVRVTADAAEVLAADRVVFPGQGAMRDCMREMDDRGLRPALLRAAETKPFLGICIGLQMLFERSEEGGGVDGLAILPGHVRRFPHEAMQTPAGERLKVPHMGWNEVRQRAHPMWSGIPDGDRFYFVHSYYVESSEASLVSGQSEYAFPFTCAVARDNIFAVQFHPEKSHHAGLRLLSNFVSWTP